MAITIIHVNRIVTADGAGTSTGGNWLATDTIVANKGTSLTIPYRSYVMGAQESGFIREFSVSNVAADRTVLYIESGIYLIRVTTAGQSILLRKSFPAAAIGTSFGPGKDYDTDAALTSDPTATSGLTTIDGVTIGGQPVNTRHHIVRETEGPRRIRITQYTKIGIVASALATAVELEIGG